VKSTTSVSNIKTEFSNRYDVPNEVVQTYVKRWRIEVFFRTAKQELAFEKCHSESEAHHHAHFELLFAAETLLAVALFELNKEKTSDEGYTQTRNFYQGLPRSG
jgi:hypothetical protein